MYLSLACFIILALTFSDFWPEWLQIGLYKSIMSYVIFFAFFYIFRIVLWIVPYHFGFDFWLFPAYRSAWMPQNYLKAPFVSFDKKKNANSIGSLVWRSMTGSLIIYSLYGIGIHEMELKSVTNYCSDWLTNALDP